MFSLCVPTYNRVSETLDSFSLVASNLDIDEIIIHDDGSDLEIYRDLERKISNLNNSKIKLLRQEINTGAFINKFLSVAKAKNEYVILLDSDNRINSEYIEIIKSQILSPEVILLPEQTGIPNLDYSKFSNMIFDKTSYKNKITNDLFSAMMNTGNYVVNKNSFVLAYELESDKKHPYGVDVFYMNYLYMKHIPDAKFFVVPKLKYEHRLSKDGYWIRNSQNSNVFLENIKKKIQEEFL